MMLDELNSLYIHCVTKDGSGLLIPLPPPPKCRGYRQGSPCTVEASSLDAVTEATTDDPCRELCPGSEVLCVSLVLEQLL